ncbi:alpha-N-acetylglucosaminidase TIM-barrel domain-containing protein [Goodfellowiella coeruleoviolacea]|uniref:Alpha-N-acetylglucosaminidase (NAGLU) N-terminal domain-containing protein n=1 Tax=Goodfellowiella coeruleoviolacea TaxID=334858 RepID=A0AAE3GLP9_9PSEU|nr:alpha-N-acetylglucosaminidase TIM-barrel domain-containing protein [Goodfellowiella coeruleoviolacea]MCP2169797.1 Alpha-N-acetylglucosaminidase (NAGLU) N-terminal domain-containing protein [Goodfellowiella coeruleoviolacea]
MSAWARGKQHNGFSRRTLLVGAGAAAVAGLVPLGTRRAAAAPSTVDGDAARAAITRLLGGDTARASQFTLASLPADGDADRFTIGGSTGQVALAGTSTVALVSAFHWWLKHVANAHLSWNGDQLALPERLPAPAEAITRRTELTDRYAYNFCVFGYTAPYWSWSDWERELDYLAASGVNLALSLVGQEIVWYETFPKFGLTQNQVLTWIPYSAHQPWVWYGSISVGGSVTTGFLRRRAELGAKIADRMRELGITPVFPAFIGHVPNDIFASANPAAKVVPQGSYNGQPRPDWLASTDPLFHDVATAFYAAQANHFGVTTHYSNDLLHEGGTTGDVPLAQAAQAVQAAMTSAAPGAVWVLQGWAGNPRQALIEAVDTDRVLVLDLNADIAETWKSTSAYWGAPWAWGSIGNFGGRLGMFGSLHEPAETLPAIRKLPAAERGRLRGTAAMAEAHHHNPVTGDLWGETAWRDEPLDLTEWIAGYARRRYGRDDPRAVAAWQTLLATAYRFRKEEQTTGEGPYETPFAALPSLTVTRSSRTAPRTPRYDLDLFIPAFVDLVAADPALRALPTYRYDLVDVTRQLLANRSRQLLDEIRAAHQARDVGLFRTLSARFLRYLDLTDELLATDEHWLLGRWLAAARSWGETAQEKAQLEYDARSIITIWTPKAYERLREYANREWHGLLADYYRPRWSGYFDEVAARLAAGDTSLPSSEPAAWAASSEAWTRQTTTYPDQPSGDTYEVVRRIVAELTAEPGQGALRITPAEQVLCAPGTTTEVRVRFTNRDPGRPRTGVRTALTALGSTAVVAVGGTGFAEVAPGASVTTLWRVTPPASALPKDTAMVTTTLTAVADYTDGDRAHQARQTSVLRVGQPPQAPNQTHATTTGGAAQQGKRYTVFAAGQDMWSTTQEFAAVYRQDVLGVGESVVTAVTRQDNTGPWARAGLLVRNSVPQAKSPAAVVLARTPGNGLALQWDSTGGGKLDRTVSFAWTASQVWLKLTRTGSTTFTAHASGDGTRWQQVGQADAPGAVSRMDAALFVCAVNADGVIGSADFTGFQIQRAGNPGNDLHRYQASGRVVAAPNKDGRLELFVATATGVWNRTQTAANGGWGGWRDIGGPAGATLAIGRDATGTLELFAATAQGTWQRGQTAVNGGWGAWQHTGGPGGRDIVVGPSEDGRLEVFLGAADGVHHRWRTTAGGWSGWQPEQGPANAVLALAREAGGTLVLVASGADGTFQRDQSAINAGWGPWLAIGPAGADLAVVPDEDDRLELFLATGDGVLHRYQGTTSGDWTAFTPVGGPANARLAAARDPDGLVHVVATTPTEAWQRAQTAANAGWGAWQRIGTGGVDVDLATNADGRLEAHSARPDQVWVRFQRSPDHAWSDWQAFGGPPSGQ